MVERHRKPGRTDPALAELAEDWLTAKRAMESAGQAAKGHSDLARRADLARWGRLLSAGRGLVSDEETPLDVAVELAAVSVRDLTTDAVVNAVAEAKSMWSDATVARMLSTLRGFTRWLTRQTDHPQPRPQLAADCCRVGANGAVGQ